MSQKRSIRERRRETRRRQQRTSKLIAGLLVAGGLAFVGFLVWNSFGRPAIGEVVPVAGEGDHVADGGPLPPYSTNPPTSGTHYISSMPEGFYDETSQEATSLPNPEGYIVHSLEHGYVVFWYNCALLSSADACSALKSEIKAVMSNYNNFKIIAFPWTNTDAPVIATSWGRMLTMDGWDPDLATEFIERNRNQAPEPNAR